MIMIINLMLINLMIKKGRQGQGHADLRENHLGQDDHPGGRGLGHHRQPEDQDPGEGGHPDPPADPELRWQAVGR